MFNMLTANGENWNVCRVVFGAVSRELPVERESIQTQLHQRTNQEHYTYTNVPWRLYLRKEVCAGVRRYKHTPVVEPFP